MNTIKSRVTQTLILLYCAMTQQARSQILINEVTQYHRFILCFQNHEECSFTQSLKTQWVPLPTHKSLNASCQPQFSAEVDRKNCTYVHYLQQISLIIVLCHTDVSISCNTDFWYIMIKQGPSSNSVFYILFIKDSMYLTVWGNSSSKHYSISLYFFLFVLKCVFRF